MSLYEKFPAEIAKRIENGTMIDQKCYQFIKELNSYSEEKLSATAIIYNGKKYSYRKMFRDWEKYASVFTALGITEENGSRLGFVSSKSYDSICAFYGVNMTGASVSNIHELDLLDTKRWDTLIEKEGITDVLISSKALAPVLANRRAVYRVLDSCERLGIRNLIILDTEDNDRPYKVREHTVRRALTKEDHVLYMTDLMDKYEGTPISYGSESSQEAAVIIHTSGTTSGIHKPIPLSDKALNESAARLLRDDRFNSLKRVVTLMVIGLPVSFGLCDMLHLPLSYGGTIIVHGNNGPDFNLVKLIEKYRPTVLFAPSVLMDILKKINITPDLSSVAFLFTGGAYVSLENRKEINKFLRRCGSRAKVSVGYGLSEIGAAAILSDADETRDTIGDPLPGVKVKLFNEQENKYYDISDGPRTGVLFLSSASLSSGRIGDEIFFELEEIDGEQYLNTYDLVDLREDGSMQIIGRMNKYFVNNDGVRFDAGLVETAVSSQPGIVCCGLVPDYNKLIHDTVPVLYVQTKETTGNRVESVKKALYNVFVRDNRIVDSNLPSKVVIVKDIPLNQTGKVDIYAIQKEHTKGRHYCVEAIRRNGRLVDIMLKEIPADSLSVTMDPGGSIPEELEKDSNLFQQLLTPRGMDDFAHGGMPGADMPMDEFDPRMMRMFMEEMLRHTGCARRMRDGYPVPCGWMYLLTTFLRDFADDMEKAYDRRPPCPAPHGRHRRPPFPRFDEYADSYDDYDNDDDFADEYDDYDEETRPRRRRRPPMPFDRRHFRPPFPHFNEYADNYDDDADDGYDEDYDDYDEELRPRRRRRPPMPFDRRHFRPPFPHFNEYADDYDDDADDSYEEAYDDYDEELRPRRRRRPPMPFDRRHHRPPFMCSNDYEDDFGDTENLMRSLSRFLRFMFRASDYDEFYEE